MDNWIGLLLCMGAYFIALMFIWAFFVGATRGNMTEEEWLEHITSTPPNNQESQQ